MGRKLRVRDRILLLLADLGDVLEEWRDPGGLVSNYYQVVYGWIPYRYKRSNFRATLERLLKVGYIEKVIKNGEPCLRLSSAGYKKLVRDFPLVLLKGKRWQGTGTLVVFDIEEKRREKRDWFREWLLRLGAGMVQRSVYLFPYDLVLEIQETVTNFGLEKEVEVFPADLRFIRNKRRFARRVWRLERIGKEYQLLLNEILALESHKGKERQRLNRWIKARYLEILISDPCLPEEFLPPGWIGKKVKKLIRNLK